MNIIKYQKDKSLSKPGLEISNSIHMTSNIKVRSTSKIKDKGWNFQIHDIKFDGLKNLTRCFNKRRDLTVNLKFKPYLKI